MDMASLQDRTDIVRPRMPSRAPDYVTGATISSDKVAWMEAHLPRHPGRAMDLGCGAGLYARWLLERGWKVLAVDLKPPRLTGIETLAHDLETGLPLPDGAFEAVLAWDVLEHLAEEERMWSEIARVLRPGGCLIGSVPHDADQRLRPYNLVFKHHTDRTHHREYTRGMIEERVARAGLVGLRVSPRGPVSPQVLSEFVRWPRARRPVARVVGGLRRMGLLSFGELYADLFFAADKPSDA